MVGEKPVSEEEFKTKVQGFGWVAIKGYSITESGKIESTTANNNDNEDGTSDTGETMFLFKDDYLRIFLPKYEAKFDMPLPDVFSDRIYFYWNIKKRMVNKEILIYSDCTEYVCKVSDKYMTTISYATAGYHDLEPVWQYTIFEKLDWWIVDRYEKAGYTQCDEFVLDDYIEGYHPDE